MNYYPNDLTGLVTEFLFQNLNLNQKLHQTL